MLAFFQDIADKFGLTPHLPAVEAAVKKALPTPTITPAKPAAPSNVGNVLPSLVETGKEILRAPGRAIGQVFSSYYGQDFQAETKVQKFMFGDKPIKSLSSTGADTLTGFGAGPATSKKYGLTVGVAGALLDAIPPIGGFEKNALEKIALSKSEKEIATLLRQSKVAEDLVPQLSKDLVGVSKVEDVTKTISNATAKSQERGFVSTVKESPTTPAPLAERVAGDYVPRDTADLSTKAQNLVRDDIQTAHRVAAQGTDDTAVATSMELIKHYGELASKAGSEAEKLAFYDKQAEVANQIAPKLTELGRGVQAASIYSRLTPEGFVRFAASEIDKYNAVAKVKIPGLTGEQASKFSGEMTRIKGMADGTEKAMATQKLFEEAQKLLPSSLYDKVVSVWKAGLLTGLKTTGANIISNTVHGAMEIAKDAPAVVVDKVASLFTGERTKTFTTGGTGGGIKEGFEKGWQYLKTGFDERNSAVKLDYRKVNFGTSPVARALQTYEETIFHMMGAEDQPFYYGAKARSLQDQALAAAKNEGLKGAERTAFVEKFVANPTDDALKYAVHDAETAVFQNKTVLGDTAKALQRVPGAGQFIVPFTGTPGAVATQLINYSPVGLAKTIIENIGKGKFDQRLFSQGVGRALTGTGILAIGSALFGKGMISLSAPTSEKERKQWELEGKKANSILINGEWRSLSTLGPAGNVLIVGGYYQQALSETGSPTKAIFAAIAGAGKSITDQTFLKGLSGALNAVNDPLRYGQTFAESTAGSVIPTISSDVAQATDPTQRDPNGILETIESRIPVLRQTLNSKVNVLGKDIPRNEGFLGTMADPFRASPEKSDPVISELRRLSDAGQSVTPTSPKQSYTIAGGKVSLSHDQLHELKVSVGSRTAEGFTQLLTASEYQALADSDKAKLLQRIHDKVRQQEEFKILSPDQRKALIDSLDSKGKEAFAKELQSAFGQ